MNLLFLLVLFSLACATITVCFTKKRMEVARAVFLGLGIAIAFSSALLIWAQHEIDLPYVDPSESQSIRHIVTYVLGIGTVFYTLVLIAVGIATVIWSFLALRKIAEYVKGKILDFARKSNICLKLQQEESSSRRKIFLLFCRLIN